MSPGDACDRWAPGGDPVGPDPASALDFDARWETSRTRAASERLAIGPESLGGAEDQPADRSRAAGTRARSPQSNARRRRSRHCPTRRITPQLSRRLSMATVGALPLRRYSWAIPRTEAARRRRSLGRATPRTPDELMEEDVEVRAEAGPRAVHETLPIHVGPLGTGVSGTLVANFTLLGSGRRARGGAGARRNVVCGADSRGAVDALESTRRGSSWGEASSPRRAQAGSADSHAAIQSTFRDAPRRRRSAPGGR